MATHKITPAEVRFWKKVRGDSNGCWVWTGAHGAKGHGTFWEKPDFIGAHVWAYKTLIGPLPEGTEIDHLCRNPPCVNPTHMEPVTHRENVLRGEGLPAQRAKQTQCRLGHEFTRMNDGRRRCLICKRRWHQLHPTHRQPAS